MNSTKKKDRYPNRKGKFGIELKLQDVRQLFDQRDPAPFRERDLDDDASEYIITCYQDILPKEVSFLEISFSQPLALHITEAEVIESIRSHFEYEAERVRKKVKTILKTGTQSLFIGLTFLTIATFFHGLVKPSMEANFTMNFLKEGLMLLGWVSMWKPFSIFLYEWWPWVELRNVYLNLAQIEIKILSANEQSLPRDESVRAFKANP